ncbi:MAG: hypothetical protein DRI52_10895 [Chloroflexi bacterium]|nr:MAG: hypothetical protein DRI52_10895 [Chloroflexota bacterium]RLI49694.1 MAG: hypothetical protein DRO73_05500 [Candidatus Thorarchaeota archaeon]
MRVTLLGTGTSYPDPERVQSGVLVEINDMYVLFDVGSGILQRLNQLRIPLTKIHHIFVSHFHIDHCSDLPTLYQSLWMSGYDGTLHLYGPPMIDDWYRGIFTVSFPYMRDRILLELIRLDEFHAVQIADMSVTTCPTLHGSIESRAFKIEHDGRSIVYTSDTAPCPEVIALARGADLLIHECNWLDGDHPAGVHTSPSQLAKIVEQTQPKTVVLTHLGPEVVAQEKRVVDIVARRTNARVVMGRDLLVLDT